jgi:ferredoxin
MIRKIITINKELCNGCGICVDACHEDAIGIIDGKATLLRDDYCDGLGNCLPACPVNAISFEEREALEYNDEEVKKNIAKKNALAHGSGCPSSHGILIEPKEAREDTSSYIPPSRLNQWPIQIQLVAPNAPYFNNADLLIAADCTAFAYGDFHNELIKDKITLIGCPKLDEVDYSIKLTNILSNNNIKSITVVRMIVPCCAGIVNALKTAIENSGKSIPLRTVIISTDGTITNH